MERARKRENEEENGKKTDVNLREDERDLGNSSKESREEILRHFC